MSQPYEPRHMAKSPERQPLDRRSFLRRLGVVGGTVVVGGGLAATGEAIFGGKAAEKAGGVTGTTTTRPAAHGSGRPPRKPLRPGQMPDLPTADWLIEENGRLGTTDWRHVGTNFQSELEGFADTTSATAGDEVTLRINTVKKRVHAEIYRMGWYGGQGGRLVATTESVPGQVQPAAELTSGINMTECHWAPSITFKVGSDWPPGNYLLRLLSDDGFGQWVPLTIRDDRSQAAIAMMNCVTTWQAYSLWGNYSLYYGEDPGGGASYANRARVVSFDKPYPYHWAAGSAGWIGTEFSFLMLAERHGLDLAYLTDVDMHARPESIQAHQCLVSLGHDEYWSKAMRDGALAALDKGVNFAFLGANACYRHIRLEDSPVGPYRREVCYKDGPEDPLYGVDNADVTANWYDGPDSWAESNLVGSMYQCYGGSGDMVIVDPGSWLLHGTGLAAGDRIVKVIGSEFDACAPALGSPSNIRIVSHAPTPSAIGNWYSDMTWFTSQKPGGGGVFASGTMNFIPFLWDNPGTLPTSWAFDAIPGATKQLEQITLNVLAVTGEGPASRTFPSEPNWESYYKPTDTGLTGGEK